MTTAGVGKKCSAAGRDVSRRVTGPARRAPALALSEPHRTIENGQNDGMADTVLSPNELELIDAYWRAANYLSVGQIYLLDNPLLRRAARSRARQAAAARPLRDDAGAQLHLRAPESRDQGTRPVGDLHHRARPRRPGPRRERLPRRHVLRALPAHLRGRSRTAGALPPVLVPRRHPVARRAGDAGLDPRGRRARLRPVARVRRRVRQPRPRSSPASSATARPRPGRSRRAGTRTSS